MMSQGMPYIQGPASTRLAKKRTLVSWEKNACNKTGHGAPVNPENEPDTLLSDTLRTGDILKLNDKMEDDAMYTKSTVQLEGDMQPNDTLPGSSGMVHSPEDAYQKYD
jgi:hypothetical protein